VNDGRSGHDPHATDAPSVPEVPLRAVRPLYTRPSLVLLIVLGGGVGTVLRYLAEEARPAPTGGWPWTTFSVNVLGSFILGALLTALARSGPDQGWRRRARLGLGTGFCGGFTTYSTFIIEIDSLLRGGWATLAITYALVSAVVGIAAALCGVLAVSALPRRAGSGVGG
jgi:CrcB protein